MRLVLDTNILVAALIKDSMTRRILLLPDLEFLLPAFALGELARHRAKIARAARLKMDDIDLLLTLLLTSVVVVPFERIKPYLPAADALMGAIDPDDVPFVHSRSRNNMMGFGRMIGRSRKSQVSNCGPRPVSKRICASEHHLGEPHRGSNCFTHQAG